MSFISETSTQEGNTGDVQLAGNPVERAETEMKPTGVLAGDSCSSAEAETGNQESGRTQMKFVVGRRRRRSLPGQRRGGEVMTKKN